MSIIAAIPVVISFILVIVALVFTPGTVTSKGKYLHADDRTTPLGLKDVAVTVSVLSFTLLMLIISIVLIMKGGKSHPIPNPY
jgi:hypothetical protein